MNKEKEYEVRGIQPCPKCGSDNKNMERLINIYTIKCSDCGWSNRSMRLNRPPRNQKEVNDIYTDQMRMWNKDVSNELSQKRAKPIRLVEVK